MGNQNGSQRMRHEYQAASKKSAWGKEKKRDPSKKDEDVVSVKSVKLRDFQKTQTAPLLLDLLDEAYERRMVDVRSPTRRLDDNPIAPLNQDEEQPERSRFPVLETNKQIEKLLKTCEGYENTEFLSEQCSSVMSHFENIRPIIGFHTSTQELLMCLEGPIAVECRGEEYFAPIAIWLHKDFPSEPPSVYVTSNGVILQHGHSHVTPQGEVLSPYLRDWEPESSSLIGLLDTLVNLFSHNPVFAVSSDSEEAELYDVFTNDVDSSEAKTEDEDHPFSLDEELEQIYAQFTSAAGGQMTFDEFVQCWKKLRLDPDVNLHDTFSMLDSKKTGYLSIEDFISFVKSWDDPSSFLERHSDFVKTAVHEFLVMTGLWPMCEHVLVKHKYDLQKSYDEFCTRGIGQMIQMEAKEILQTLPKKIEIERLQRYQMEIQNLKQENELLKERINLEERQAIIQDTWYDGTDATELMSKEKSEQVAASEIENNSFDENNVVQNDSTQIDSHE